MCSARCLRCALWVVCSVCLCDACCVVYARCAVCVFCLFACYCVEYDECFARAAVLCARIAFVLRVHAICV